MDKKEEFEVERLDRINSYQDNDKLLKAANSFMIESTKPKYSYNFSWMGRPIIQYPQDIVEMQEIIWKVQPDLIIETGIAHGGSLIFYASILDLIGKGSVLGVDIDIREYNKKEILNHPMNKRIKMIQGSSIDKDTVKKVNEIAQGCETILVCLDSNHTHEHVLKELNLYAGLTTLNSYCIVFDTIVENLPKNFYPDRPWEVGNNPKTAVSEFLINNNTFEVDKNIDSKLLISAAPGGYLKRIG
jgi:cephalosporin hydroxylase